MLLGPVRLHHNQFQLEVSCTDDNRKRLQLIHSYMHEKHIENIMTTSYSVLCEETVVCVIYRLFTKQTAGSRLLAAVCLPHPVSERYRLSLTAFAARRIGANQRRKMAGKITNGSIFYPRSDFQKNVGTRTETIRV